jgi:type 1 glutamine amidotransferase
VRRRALEPGKMAMIKHYVTSGKPVLGIRTASHAFALREHVSGSMSVWPEFDEEILGGNYQDHYGHTDDGCAVSIVPGMEQHPLLRGVDSQGFTTLSTLYKNKPLRSGNAQVLLLGTIPGQESEPVLWSNKNKYGIAIYNSLGHVKDWENENFRNIMFNSVDYLLDKKSE